MDSSWSGPHFPGYKLVECGNASFLATLHQVQVFHSHVWLLILYNLGNVQLSITLRFPTTPFIRFTAPLKNYTHRSHLKTNRFNRRGFIGLRGVGDIVPYFAMDTTKLIKTCPFPAFAECTIPWNQAPCTECPVPFQSCTVYKLFPRVTEDHFLWTHQTEAGKNKTYGSAEATDLGNIPPVYYQGTKTEF